MSSSSTRTRSTTSEGALLARRRDEWDAVMSTYLPDSRGFEAAMFTAVEAAGGPPRGAVDLGGGPGVLAGRMAQRWPGCAVGLVDVDPVLLALARAGLDGTATVHEADLCSSAWRTAITAPCDLLTLVMTAHYLDAAQVRALYADARGVLAPGGRLVIADLMPEPGAGGSGHEPDGSAWLHWWHEVAGDPVLGPLFGERAILFADRGGDDVTPAAGWHLRATRAAGFADAEVVWRSGDHAAVVATTPGE